MITAPFPSTAFRTRVPTRSVPRSSRGAAWLTPAGSPAPPRSCPRIVPAHSRDDHTIRRNLMCVPARRKPKTKKARLAAGTPRALQPFVSFDSSSSTFSGNCPENINKSECRMIKQSVGFFSHCREIDSAARATALDRLECRRLLGRNRQPAFSLFSSGRLSALARNTNSRCLGPEVATRGRAARGVPGGRSVGEARCDARLVVGG